MSRNSDTGERRKLDMHKVQGRAAITVLCSGLDITREQAVELLRGVHFVTDVALKGDDNLVVSYSTCTVGRIKQNVLNHLKGHITT